MCVCVCVCMNSLCFDVRPFLFVSRAAMRTSQSRRRISYGQAEKSLSHHITSHRILPNYIAQNAENSRRVTSINLIYLVACRCRCRCRGPRPAPARREGPHKEACGDLWGEPKVRTGVMAVISAGCFVCSRYDASFSCALMELKCRSPFHSPFSPC